MAQFDVYKNPSTKTRQHIPYVVDIQHDLITELATRIVLPIADAIYLKHESMTILTPVIGFKAKKMIVLTPQMASLPTSVLGKPVGSLAHLRNEIIAALDFIFSGI